MAYIMGIINYATMEANPTNRRQIVREVCELHKAFEGEDSEQAKEIRFLCEEIELSLKGMLTTPE